MREARLVFGEVAEQYDRARPSYPDELFDAVLEYSGLGPGGRALEIGAGTGKATLPFIARGINVVALEPSAGMAAVLRSKGVTVEETTFEAAEVSERFPLLYAAQSWHWVPEAVRYAKATSALAPRGAIALFWNKPEQFTGDLADAMDAVYDEHAPELRNGYDSFVQLLDTGKELEAAGFVDVRALTFHWSWIQTTAEYIALHQTHSNHRMLPDDRRTALHDGVAAVIDERGGNVEVVYDTLLFMALRG